ncbi:MAG: hypothetical protein JSR61_13725 [Proteobacteria bacterium]|nr:hypothetical protein [Pseudomonadota bacterium]
MTPARRANTPGDVPVTPSHALNNATLPFGLALAGGGLKAVLADAHLRNGLNVHKGKITYQAVADSLHLPYVSAEDAIAA